jgi:hypothetical protein
VSWEGSVLDRNMYVVLYFHSQWMACAKSITLFFQFQKKKEAKPSLKVCYNTNTLIGHCTYLVLAVETQVFGNWFCLHNQVKIKKYLIEAIRRCGDTD